MVCCNDPRHWGALGAEAADGVEIDSCFGQCLQVSFCSHSLRTDFAFQQYEPNIFAVEVAVLDLCEYTLE